MYTVYNMNLITTNCPEGMTEHTCPLRKYINNEQHAFHTSFNETHLIPDTCDWAELGRICNKMRTICNECLEKQKTR